MGEERSRALYCALLVTASLALVAPAWAQDPGAAIEDAVPATTTEDAAPLAEPVVGEPTTTTEAASTPAPEPVDLAGPVGGAAAEAVAAAQAGGEGVKEQGRKVWIEALVPMWERFATSIPVILKALLVLAIFWVLAWLLGTGTTKLLSMTDWDERAAKDWGLAKLLQGEGREPVDINRLGGTVVKWVVLLFGLVAFFDTLNLSMVAGPLQGVLNNLFSVIPALLTASVILLVYWIVATILKMAASKGLAAVGFDQRAEKYFPPRELKGEMVPASGVIGRLIFYVVLLFGIPPFLDALGQESLVTPLRDMLSKALSYIPNIIAALILVFVGRLVATIVREVVTNFLAAVGADRAAKRLGFGKSDSVKPLSQIAGTVAYFFILVPVLVAAVDALKIDAISMPVRNTLEQLLSMIPLIFGGVIVVAVGYYIANAVRGIVTSFLSGVGFDALPGKLGLDFLKPKEGGGSLSAIGGTIVMALILLLTAEQALATLNLERLSALVGDLIRYLPNLAVGLVIILAALSLGGYVGDLVTSALSGSRHQRLLSNVARYAIIFLGASMGLTQLGVGQDVIQMVVAAVVGGAALAVGLAFGLGGKERAQRILDRSDIV
jgi:hypothetical protein